MFVKLQNRSSKRRLLPVVTDEPLVELEAHRIDVFLQPIDSTFKAQLLFASTLSRRGRRRHRRLLLFVRAGLSQFLPSNFDEGVLRLRVLVQGAPEVVLRQDEDVAVADALDVCYSPVARCVARDIEQTDLAKEPSSGDGCHGRSTILGQHAQQSGLDDVHLLAYVPPATDVVAGTVDD